MAEVDLRYAMSGRGGAIWWLDTNGGVPWSAVAAVCDFILLPRSTGPWRERATGSFLTTAPFHLADGQELTVTATMVTAHPQTMNDVGFGVLLDHRRVEAVLFAQRPTDGNLLGDQGPIEENTYAPEGPGVTLVHGPGGLVKINLGGVQYGAPPVDGSDCANRCSADVTAVCAPGAGEYSLLFGMFGIPPEIPREKPAAMIVACAPLPVASAPPGAPTNVRVSVG